MLNCWRIYEMVRSIVSQYWGCCCGESAASEKERGMPWNCVVGRQWRWRGWIEEPLLLPQDIGRSRPRTHGCCFVMLTFLGGMDRYGDASLPLCSSALTPLLQRVVIIIGEEDGISLKETQSSGLKLNKLLRRDFEKRKIAENKSIFTS